MKIILSRKGFDSKYGGYSNIIFEDGRMLSLPIPENEDKFKHQLTYHEIFFKKGDSYKSLFNRLGHNKITDDKKRVHLDPDLQFNTLKQRPPSWKPAFGQAGNAQKFLKEHLENEDVLFLFYGTFQKVFKKAEQFEYSVEHPFHAIFGFLYANKENQFDLSVKRNETETETILGYHPHLSHSKPYNCIYLATGNKQLGENFKSGAGTFMFNEKLRLTKLGYKKSYWQLPRFFENAIIKNENKKEFFFPENYLDDDYCLMQTPSPAQEFLILSDPQNQIQDWAINLVNKSELQ